MIRIGRSLAIATLMLSIVFGARVAVAQTNAGATCSGDPRVTVGGVAGFAALADPVATASLRKSCVGLYIHSVGWKNIDPATRAQILANFAGTGPAVVELGPSKDPDKYFGTYYKHLFLDQGVKADVAIADGICGRGPTGGMVPSLTDAALKYVDDAKSVGLTKVAVIFTPNMHQFDVASFQDPRFECVRAAAKEGGALAIDAPPHVFLYSFHGRSAVYQRFVMDEIRWANSNGISTYFLVSAGSSPVPGDNLTQETSAVIDMLAANQALPTNWAFEAYCARCTDQYHQVGTENQPWSAVGVAKTLLPKIAH